jgi:hypothetical protein
MFWWSNVVFLSLQCAFICFKSRSFASTLPLPHHAQAEIALTLSAQIVLIMFVSVWQTALMRSIRTYRWSSNIFFWCAIAIIVCSISTILFANALFFPLSVFSRYLFSNIPQSILQSLLIVSSSPLIALNIYALFVFFRTKRHLAILSLCIITYLCSPHHTVQRINTSKQPNIILIGIDSLHPNDVTTTCMPTVAAFLKQSVWFQETITPLARTYPSWITILTGLHPVHHRAHYNLMPPDTTLAQQNMAWFYQQQGYQTLFATDDRRFNPIDHDFGFQTVIGPKRGINDILIGTFNDFPLSNFLVNFSISSGLFPYNHMNRASHFTYYPNTFNHAITRALQSRVADKPIFLAVHFTLPHWPYAFATSKAKDVNNEYQIEQHQKLYQASLHAADTQVQQLMTTLKQQGFWDHSIVILLSDHGETLYTPGSRFISKNRYQKTGHSALETYFSHQTSTDFDKSVGHGSDLLSPVQYHCVLAFQRYQHNSSTMPPHIITDRVSLMDIAPTLFDMTHVSQFHAFDGLSLSPYLNTRHHMMPSRGFIMESGMLPNQFLSQKQARDLGEKLFTIEPTDGFLHLRFDALPKLDALKIYAILQDDWLLALYPTSQGYLPIVQHLKTGAWVDDLHASFAQHSPAAQLLNKLTEIYQHPWHIAPSSHKAALSPPQRL